MVSVIVRVAWPLLPAWLAGGVILVFSSAVWVPGPPTPMDGDPIADGWFLLVSLVVGSALFALAPVLGPMALVVTPSSSHHSFGRPTSGQQGLGTGTMRVLVLACVYLVVLGIGSCAWA